VCATFTSYMQDPENLLRLNTCVADPYQRRVALGLGTGLGLKDGVLLPDGNFWLGKNEAGHIGIINPPLADSTRLSQHQEFMRFLYRKQEKSQQQITFENILTGRGLVHLYQFLHPSSAEITPEFVGEQMTSNKANDVMDLFAWYLGLYVGSVQLIFLPEGGVWITGGVVIKHLEIFQQPAFAAGIVSSPAFQEERSKYALGVMVNPQHALIGAGFYAVRKLLSPVTSLSASLQ
jgi:glucokinase